MTVIIPAMTQEHQRMAVRPAQVRGRDFGLNELFSQNVPILAQEHTLLAELLLV